jgi:transcriptional regulator with XRE-family HTH domain
MAQGLDPRPTPIQRFGRELARVRKARGLSQEALAPHLGVSKSLIGHIEIGDRTPKEDLATRCDRFFDTGDLFLRLCRNITTPASPGWYIRWTDEIEPRAHILRSWDPMLVPGLLQTEDYARAIFRGHIPVGNDEIENKVSARMRRQLILERDDPPTLWALLDEGVLHRLIGSPEIMLHQLDHLLKMTERLNVTIQLIPRDTTCTVGWSSGFVLAELKDHPDVISVEAAGRSHVSTEQSLVATIWSMYDKLRAEALRPHESLNLIKEARGRWQSGT